MDPDHQRQRPPDRRDHGGMAIHFSEDDVRIVGRTARGVKAITLEEGDTVVGMAIAREGGELLTITESGLGRAPRSVSTGCSTAAARASRITAARAAQSLASR